MSLIVQKFGGSSVANAERVFNVARIVTDTYKKGNKVVVVVSAQGDTTDDLIEKANEINPNASKREKDMLLAAGEQISISLLAMAIEKLGYPVVSLLGWQAGFQTSSAYTSARIKRVRTDRIIKELDKNNIVVVAGFQGINRYDDVIVVSDALVKPTADIKGNSDNISVINNMNDVDKIIEKSNGEIEFIEDRSFIHTSNPNGIDGVLKSDAKKFISIGNFEPQKGYNRLVKAFDRFCEDYPDTQLLLIGGHGEFQEMIKMVSGLKHGDNISIVKWVNNPMPILKQCDLFIQSSEFEGWSMVAMEANTLNVPIISTDIAGSKWINDNGGYLVPNSENGLLQGMYDFMNGNVSDFDYDYQAHNEKVINEFNELIRKNVGDL